MTPPRRLSWRGFLAAVRGLGSDEEGASLVFAAITMFSLVLATMAVYQVGMVSADRLQMQGAADAAAYSAAQVEATSLDAIGQVGDGMAYLHYTLLRYTVDAIVYGTLDEFRRHDRTVPASRLRQQIQPASATAPNPPDVMGGHNPAGPDWVMMGGNVGPRRLQRTQQIVQRRLDQGKQWLDDLHFAQRLIMAATPRLAARTAAEVAAANGASHIAVSADLERAFRIREQDRGGGTGGFSEGTGDRAAEPLYARYAERVLEVDGRKRGFPNWFDAPGGKANSQGYSQVRLCWNGHDWAHRSQAEIHLGGEYTRYMFGAPNGHWHARHTHYIVTDPGPPAVITPVQHGGLNGNQEAPTSGGGFGGGHTLVGTEDDQIIHQQARDALMAMPPFFDAAAWMPHHAAIRCPTCWAQNYDGSSFWSEVQKKQRDVRDPGMKKAQELTFRGLAFPRPLRMEEALLRSGITVVAWRPSHGIGALLPASGWGMIAVASAQVGYLDRNGVVLPLQRLSATAATYGVRGGATQDVPLGSTNDPSYRNLFYSADPARGVRFGARLVPIAGDLTTHSSLVGGRSLDELLRNGSRWRRTDDPGANAPAPPPGLAALRQQVAADSPAALKAFWH